MTSPADHLLYVLLDSNLPTGGFVASSGLESWAKHGFLHFDPIPSERSHGHASSSNGDHDAVEDGLKYGRRPASQMGAAAGVMAFTEAEMGSYHSTTGPFVRAAWEIVRLYLDSNTVAAPKSEDLIVDKLLRLDQYHEVSLLSHVSRRASKAQGVAMLTLYTKGLCPPIGSELSRAKVGPYVEGDTASPHEMEGRQQRDLTARSLIDAYKLLIRKAQAPGHLSIAWAVITAALGIPLGQSPS